MRLKISQKKYALPNVDEDGFTQRLIKQMVAKNFYCFSAGLRFSLSKQSIDAIYLILFIHSIKSF